MRPTTRHRSVAGRFLWTTTRKLVAVNVAVFILQYLAESLLSPAGITQFYLHTLLSPLAIMQGWAWTIITYSFFHAGLWHILGNMLGLWFAGHLIEQEEGRARLLGIYGGGVVLGGLLWLGLAFFGQGYSPLLGASAGVFAVLTYALARQFDQPIRIFIYFVFPVTLRSKWVLLGLGVITLGGLFFSEIPGTTGWWAARWAPGIAHSGHLGGMLCGGVVFAWNRWRSWLPRGERKKLIPLRQTVAVRASSRSDSVDNVMTFSSAGGASVDTLKAEVDRILEKIKAAGLNSLTKAEHETLERARKILRR